LVLNSGAGAVTIAANDVTGATSITTPHAAGTVYTALTGAGMTKIVIFAAEGTVFDAVTDVTVSGSVTSTELEANVGSATSVVDEMVLDALGGATVVTQTIEDGLTIEFSLTELQRVHLIALSNTPGGDGVALTMSFQQAFLTDVALNGNAAQTAVVVTEYPDVIVPLIISARMFYETGLLSLQFNETIDATLANGNSGTDLTKLALVNAIAGNEIPLVGATIETSADGFEINITLTELQRVAGIALSKYPGGDGVSVVLDSQLGSFKDVAQNDIPTQLGFAVEEFQDLRQPLPIRAQLHLSIGVLTLASDEIMDLTPLYGGNVNLTAIALINDSVTSSGQAALAQYYDLVAPDPYETYGFIVLVNGSNISTNPANADGYEFNITLSELQRSRAIALSGTPGGDSLALNLRVDIGSFFDIARNPSHALVTAGALLVVDEIADTINPRPIAAEIHYGLFYIKITFDEYIDTTPNTLVNLNKMFVSSTTGGHEVSLAGLDVRESDGYVVTLTLIESVRIAAMGYSAGPAGDGLGTASVLDVNPNAVQDIGQNPNNIAFHFDMVEHEDEDPPLFLSATINYTTGILVVSSQETLGIQTLPAKQNLSGYILRNVTDTVINEAAGLEQVRLGGPDNVFNLDSILSGLSSSIVSVANAMQITIQLTESQRVRAIALSGQPGGDGHAVVLDVDADATADIRGNEMLKQINIQVTESPDVQTPRPLSATIDLNDGVLRVTCDETIDVTPRTSIDPSKIYLSNTAGARNVVDLSSALILPKTYYSGSASDSTQDSTIVTVKLNEVMRIAAIENSGSVPNGGDGVALVIDFDAEAFHDIAQNDNSIYDGIVLTETPDTTAPFVVQAGCSVNYTTGVLLITANEKLDLTPSTKVDVDKFNLAELSSSSTSGVDTIVLTGSTVTATDSTTLTLQLTEAQRVLGIQMSNTPGGNGSPTELRVVAGAAKDIAQVDCVQNLTGIPLTESPDTLPPTILNGTINYGTGILTIRSDETIDAKPASLVVPDNIWLSDSSGAKQINLIGNAANSGLPFAGVLPAEGSENYVVTLKLTEYQRSEGIRISDTTGGNGGATLLDFEPGALQDIGTNPNKQQYGITLTETADTIAPNFANASLNLGNGYLVFTSTEVIDAVPTSNIDVSKWYLSNFTNASLLADTSDAYGHPSYIHLDGATFVGQSTDNMAVTIQLTEKQRTKAIYLSSTPGDEKEALGGGLPLMLEMQGGAFLDVAQNPNVLIVDGEEVRAGVGGTKMSQTEADDVAPHVIAATLHLNGVVLGLSAILQVFLSETVRIEPGFTVDYTKIHISNFTSRPPCTQPGYYCVPLAGNYVDGEWTNAPLALVTTDDSADGRGGLYFNVTLSEEQRVKALAIGGTGGGDGIATVLDVSAGAFFDRAGNPCIDQFGINITEFGDDIKPRVTNATLRLSDGLLTVELSEVLDLTPIDYLDLSNFYLTNTDNATDFGTDNQISLDGARIVNASFAIPGYIGATDLIIDSQIIYIVLTETQRVRAIELSGTTGGDGSAVTLDVSRSAFRDIAQNRNADLLDNAVIETRDDVPPELVSSTIFLSHGIVHLLASETLDLTPANKVDLSLIQLRNDASTGVTLSGSASGDAFVTTDVDYSWFAVNITETQRSRAVMFSSTPGGDGNAALLVKSLIGSFMDIGQNLNTETVTVTATEIQDNLKPQLISSTLDLNNGQLFVTADETLDLFNVWTLTLNPARSVTEIKGASVSQLAEYVYWTVALTAPATLTETKGAAVQQGAVTGILHVGVQAEYALTINSQGITEYAGAIVTQGSATGVLKTAVSNYWTVGLTTGQALEEGAGALVTQGLNTGRLRKSLSGTVATFQITAASGVSFDDTSDMLVGTTAVSGSNIASGTVLNTGAATSIIVVANSGATFVHSTAKIVIGTTSVAGADITAAVLSGTTSSFVVQAASGSVLDDSTTITVGGASINGAAIDTVTSTQATSTGYIHIGLTGASTTTISIRSQWGVVFHTLTNVVIGETAGAGGITTLAAVDVTAAVLSTNIDISKISLRNSTEEANNAIVLTDVDIYYGVASATTPSLTLVDSHPHLGLSFTILLTEELRIRAIEASGTPGGDFHPLTLDVSLGAVKDLAGNNNIGIGDGTSNEIVVVETADTTKPIVISARVDLDSRILRINADETLKNTFASNALKKFDFTKFFFFKYSGCQRFGDWKLWFNREYRYTYFRWSSDTPRCKFS
jgi:hypothetical protein